MSHSIPTGYIPSGNPWGLPQKIARGQDLNSESCPGAGNSTKAGILFKMKVNIIFIVFKDFRVVLLQSKI